MKYIENGLEVDLVKDSGGEYLQFEWRTISGYEGSYQISNYGHIKSLSRTVNSIYGPRVTQDRLMSQRDSGGI